MTNSKHVITITITIMYCCNPLQGKSVESSSWIIGWPAKDFFYTIIRCLSIISTIEKHHILILIRQCKPNWFIIIFSRLQDDLADSNPVAKLIIMTGVIILLRGKMYCVLYMHLRLKKQKISCSIGGSPKHQEMDPVYTSKPQYQKCLFGLLMSKRCLIWQLSANFSREDNSTATFIG